ncbi:hypothetical protein V3C99_002184 [Haemonchus contortus]
MDVFKVIAQIVLSTSIAVIAPCAREKKATTKPTRSAIVLKPSASSSAASRSSSSKRNAKKKAAKPAAAEVKVMPAQLRQIMEAEQMAKASKGYDSYDVELDDSDLAK